MKDMTSELPLSAEDLGFRDELRTWLSEHLSSEFAGQHDRGGPDDDDNWELLRRWEKKLGAGGWLGISWPAEYGAATRRFPRRSCWPRNWRARAHLRVRPFTV